MATGMTLLLKATSGPAFTAASPAGTKMQGALRGSTASMSSSASLDASPSSFASVAIGAVAASAVGAMVARRGAASRTTTTIPRQVKGFEKPKDRIIHKRKKVNVDQIVEDHGAEKGKIVEAILKGDAVAKSPEEILRARFSAIRSRDCVFMAKTEIDPAQPKLSKKVRGWALCFGEEKRTSSDGDPGGPEKLMSAQSLEVIGGGMFGMEGGKANEVEFKLNCGIMGILHEKAIWVEDKDFGWIYSGETVVLNAGSNGILSTPAASGSTRAVSNLGADPMGR